MEKRNAIIKNKQPPFCERCLKPGDASYCVFPVNGQSFPYLKVCKTCVGNLNLVAPLLKAMCVDPKHWTGTITNTAGVVLWSEETGQMFNPDAKTGYQWMPGVDVSPKELT